MIDLFQQEVEAKDALIQEQAKVIQAQARRETVTVRTMWFDVFEDLEKKKDKELAYWKREWEKMEERAVHAESQRDAAQDRITEQRQKIYTLETELEEEQGCCKTGDRNQTVGFCNRIPRRYLLQFKDGRTASCRLSGWCYP